MSSRYALAFPALLLNGVLASSAGGQTAPAAKAQIQERIQHVTSGLLPDVIVHRPGETSGSQTHTLAERMAALHVPGVSIAVVHDGRVEWAQGFGVVVSGGAPVTPDTLFQAGSISKPVAALAALHLVQQGRLSLDRDVNQTLKSWKVPASEAAAGKPVTLRELLTHTAGLTVHGFPGYAAGEPVPTLVQVLNGEKPANSKPIVVDTAPGTLWRYSGGGFTVAQQMMIDVSGDAFPKLMHDTVLEPLGMTHSTYEQPLPADRKAAAATPYDENGKPIEGGPHTYPEMAAAGLWTTPSDLARYILEVQTSLQGKSNHVLTQQTTQEMLTPGKGSWGLGVQIGGSPANPYFSHGGSDAGFESLFVGYEHGGEGAVIMTNGDRGGKLAGEVMLSISAEYGWPDWKPTVRTAVNVDPKILGSYAGRYLLGPGFILTVTLDGDHLAAQGTGQPKFPLDAESPTKFFPESFDAEIEFTKASDGAVNGLVLHQGGVDHSAPKQP